MYTFYVEKGSISLIKIEVLDSIIEKDSYLKELVEKCFDRVISMIKNEKKEKIDSSEEAHLEDDD